MSRSNFFIDDDGELDSHSDDLELIALVTFIRSHFAPAVDFPDATLTLKTADISARIREIYPVDFSDKQLYNALKDAGFQVHTAGQLDMFWLMKEV